MTSKRPKALKWVGNVFPDGRPERYFEFVPPRDLTEEETDALTHDQLTIIRHSPDLYREVHDTPKKAKKAAATQPEAPEPTENEPAVETVTEGEDS